MRNGLTLAEAIIGLGLLAVVVLSAVTLAITAIRSNQKASDLQVAGVLAGQQVEAFVQRLPRFNHSFWTTGGFPSPYSTDTVAFGNTTYESRLFVTDLSSHGRGLRLVTVNVSWDSGDTWRVGYGRRATSVSRLVYAH